MQKLGGKMGLSSHSMGVDKMVKKKNKYLAKYSMGAPDKKKGIARITIDWQPEYIHMTIDGAGYKNSNILWALGRAIWIFMEALDEPEVQK